MQRTSTTFQVVIAISLISMAVSVNEAFAAFHDDAMISNIINTPESMTTDVSVGSYTFSTASANANGQSPFMQVDPGTYDITITLFEGYNLVDANCAVQESDGSMTSIGTWDGIDTITGAVLTAPKAHMCHWTFESNDSGAGFTASAEEQKLLEIRGDPASVNTYYQVVVSGQIIPGPNANSNDIVSSDGTTLNAEVWTTGMDNFYFTGEIVSITSANHIFSYVDGVEVANSSTPVSEQKLLEIRGDPASVNTYYQVVVSGQIIPGPNANSNDIVSSDGTTLNAEVWTTGMDNFYFTGEIVSITSANHIFSYVDGVEVANSS